MEELLRTFGEIAGIGGLSLGIFLILFKKTSLPTGSGKHLTLFMWLVWSLALIGIATYLSVTLYAGFQDTTKKSVGINYASEPTEYSDTPYKHHDLIVKNNGNITIHDLLVRIFLFVDVDRTGSEYCQNIAKTYGAGILNIVHKHHDPGCSASLIPSNSFSIINLENSFSSASNIQPPEPENHYFSYRISELAANHKFRFTVSSAHRCGLSGIEAQVLDETGIIQSLNFPPDTSKNYERIYHRHDMCRYYQ